MSKNKRYSFPFPTEYVNDKLVTEIKNVVRDILTSIPFPFYYDLVYFCL